MSAYRQTRHTGCDTTDAAPYTQEDVRYDGNLETRKLSEKFLLDLSDEITQVWKQLGIFLSVSPPVMEELKAKVCINPENCAMNMLWAWADDREDGLVDLAELGTALNKVHRNDLVDIVNKKSDGRSTIEAKEANPIFLQLSSCLSLVWYKLGIELDVTMAKLDQIKLGKINTTDVPQSLKMLKHWNDNFTCRNSARVDALLKALGEVNRKDLKTWVGQMTSQPSYLYEKGTSNTPNPISDASHADLVQDFEELTVSKHYEEAYDEVDHCAKSKCGSIATSCRSGKTHITTISECSEKIIDLSKVGHSTKLQSHHLVECKCDSYVEDQEAIAETSSTTC